MPQTQPKLRSFVCEFHSNVAPSMNLHAQRCTMTKSRNYRFNNAHKCSNKIKIDFNIFYLRNFIVVLETISKSVQLFNGAGSKYSCAFKKPQFPIYTKSFLAIEFVQI